MAISRFSLAERRILLQNQAGAGFLKASRSSSSSSSSLGNSMITTPSDRREASKKQKAAAVESFVNKYMLMNPGIFPKTKQVQNELGGSWYLLKDILAELKVKMIDDPQVHKQIASAEADITTESASEAALKDGNEIGDMINDPGSTIHPLDFRSDQKVIESAKSHVTAEKSSEETATQEDAEKQKVRQLDSHLSPGMVHDSDQKSEFQLLSSLFKKIIGNEKRPTNASQYGLGLNNAKSSDQKAAAFQEPPLIKKMIGNEVEAPIAPQNGLNVNDTKSGHWTSVETKDISSDIKVNQSPVNKMTSNRQMLTAMADFIKNIYTNAGADEKNDMKTETLRGERCSGSKTTSANEVGNEKDIANMLDCVKKHLQSSGPHDNLNNSNQHIRYPSNKKGTATLLKHMKFQNPDKEQKILCEPDVSGDIKKTEQRETLAKSLDLVVKDASGGESKFIGNAIICDGNDRHNNNEEPMKVPFEMFESQIENKDGSRSDSDFADLDYPSESVTNVPPPINRSRIFLHTEKGKHHYKLVVRFLEKSTTEKDICAAFWDCGPIANIHIVTSRKENKFNYAYIHFKTEGGLRKAQTKKDLVICGADVVIEATSLLRNPVEMPTPDPFGCPDVPTSLVRHPSRTVMIRPLPDDLSSHCLRHALSFFGCISAFAMGSSSSIAYVEFETEDAKEKALSMSSISVSGKKLSILRIDTPLTTVVRISSVRNLKSDKVLDVCSSHGRVKRVVRRDSRSVDVHFVVAEWSNMVKIINSLNGLVINHFKWRAQPATVIPPEILQKLLLKPDGWQHVRSLIHSLCRKLEHNSINGSEFTDLVTEYHREKA